MQNPAEFVRFLIEAKLRTYAGNGEHSAPSRPRSRDLCYSRGDYTYIDTYLGNLDFAGEEAVWQGGKPIWSMNYYGYMLTDAIPDGFDKCLKGALREAPQEAPFRGPASFKYGALEYVCSWEGNLERFAGKEAILENGIELFRLVFHGGRVREVE